MAENDGDKSQEPTAKRRKEAREQGQVARSQDLASAVLLVVGSATLLWLGSGMTRGLGELFQRYLGAEAWVTADVDFALREWGATTIWIGQLLWPVTAVLLVAALLVNVAQVGFVFLPTRLIPDLARLNPLAALGRLFSQNNFTQLGFGMLKTLFISAVAFWSLSQERDTILLLPGMSVGAISVFLLQTSLWTALKIGLALLVLAVADYFWQWWRLEQDLKMTPQEVKEEMREQTGDPQVISRRRAVQRQLVLSRIAKSVPKADVVITNPTELAIAVQYDPDTMAAPIVVAKGAGLIAQRIRRLALEHGIPIVERKPLAQALYKQVEIDHPIPAGLYSAVAEVLAYVYQLTGKSIDPIRDRATVPTR